MFEIFRRKKSGIDLSKMIINDIGKPVLDTVSDEEGFITSWNDKYIFVKFGYSTQPAACKPEDLKYV